MHPAQRHPTIIALIGVAAAVFLVNAVAAPSASLEYGMVPLQVEQAWDAMREGDVSWSTLRVLLTMVTALFLHASPSHLIMNMVMFWMFGSLISEYLGRGWALGLFFVCGIGGFVLHVLLNRSSGIPCIGASGAVMGFEGLYLGLILQWRLPWPDVWPLAHPIPPQQLGLFAVLGLGFDLWGLTQTDQTIAFAAHIGGFVTGLLIAVTLTQLSPSLSRWKQRGRA